MTTVCMQNAGAQQYPKLMAGMMAKGAQLPGLHGNREPPLPPLPPLPPPSPLAPEARFSTA